MKQDLATIKKVVKGSLRQTGVPAAAAYQVDLADFFEPKLALETEFDEFQNRQEKYCNDGSVQHK